MLHHLKQFHKIKADPTYRDNSRALILRHPQKAKLNTWQNFLVFAQSGYTLAVATVMILFVIGGFSAISFIQNGGGLDNETLRAEAHAIDIQIQIADLSYGAVEEKKVDISKSTLRSATITSKNPAGVIEVKPTAEVKPDLTIDETLEVLSSI